MRNRAACLRLLRISHDSLFFSPSLRAVLLAWHSQAATLRSGDCHATARKDDRSASFF